MPIREESMDLFGNASGNVYYYEKAVSTSANGSITGNVIDLRSEDPSLVNEYRVILKVTTAVTGLTSLSAKLQHSSDNGVADNYTDLVQGATVLLANAGKGAVLLDCRLPQNCKRYVKAVVTNVGTATAGKVGGNIEVIL